MEGRVMADRARELAEEAIWDYSEYAVGKGTKAIEAGEDVVIGAIDRAFLKNRITQAIQQALDEMRKDCEVMAAWFKDLIDDEYPFGSDDEPAYKAALKYINPASLTLRVIPEETGGV
jgi:hypothetical protein